MFIVSNDGNEILKKFKDSYPLSIDDFDRKIVFDDWRYRNEMGLNYRKKDYKLFDDCSTLTRLCPLTIKKVCTRSTSERRMAIVITMSPLSL